MFTYLLRSILRHYWHAPYTQHQMFKCVAHGPKEKKETARHRKRMGGWCFRTLLTQYNWSIWIHLKRYRYNLLPNNLGPVSLKISGRRVSGIEYKREFNVFSFICFYIAKYPLKTQVNQIYYGYLIFFFFRCDGSITYLSGTHSNYIQCIE